MAHQITDQDSGALAIKPAWHGLFPVLNYLPTSQDMIREADLREPILVPVQAVHTSPIPCPDHQAVLNGRTLEPMAIVSDTYGHVSVADVFETLDNLLPDGIVRYESAFTMRAGRTLAVVARLPDADREVIPGDTLRPYLLAQTTFDGSGCIDLGPTVTRPVCANTIAIGLTEATNRGERWRIRHTPSALRRLQEARDIVADALRLFEGDVALARSLAQVRIVNPGLAIAHIIPVSDDASPATKTRAQSVRDDILSRFLSSPANNLPGMEGSAWALLNAVTEHVDHAPATYVRATHTPADTFGRRMQSPLKSRAVAVLTGLL